MQIYASSHAIEQACQTLPDLYPREAPVALSKFLRVLNSDDIAVITCPDFKSVCALIAEDKLTDPAYTSPAGPIAPLDILYGLRTSMAQGNLYMAHRCGFTQKGSDCHSACLRLQIGSKNYTRLPTH